MNFRVWENGDKNVENETPKKQESKTINDIFNLNSNNNHNNNESDNYEEYIDIDMKLQTFKQV